MSDLCVNDDLLLALLQVINIQALWIREQGASKAAYCMHEPRGVRLETLLLGP